VEGRGFSPAVKSTSSTGLQPLKPILSSSHLGSSAPDADDDLSSRIPFRRLYLHSLVRTAEGAKMSKTKGTGVDPLGLTEKFGTDALRYMLASMAAPGTDIILSEDRILGARAFANKIWNAARFLFLNLEKAEASADITLEEVAAPEIRLRAPYVAGGGGALANRWIFSRLSAVSEEVGRALQEFRFHEACQTIYHFFWGDFCDWYIEWVKPQLTATDRAVAVAAWRNIFSALDTALRLLHPVMPFLTEELWHRLPQPQSAQSIALDKFPEPRPDWNDPPAEKEMAVIQNIIIAARNIRAEMKIDPKQKTPAVITPGDTDTGYPITSEEDAIKRLANLSEIRWAGRREFDPSHGLIRSVSNFDVYIAYGEGVDKLAEITRLRKEIDRLAKDVASKQSRLADETFISKAPAKIVEDLRATLAARQIEHQKLLDRLNQLG